VQSKWPRLHRHKSFFIFVFRFTKRINFFTRCISSGGLGTGFLIGVIEVMNNLKKIFSITIILLVGVNGVWAIGGVVVQRPLLGLDALPIGEPRKEEVVQSSEAEISDLDWADFEETTLGERIGNPFEDTSVWERKFEEVALPTPPLADKRYADAAQKAKTKVSKVENSKADKITKQYEKRFRKQRERESEKERQRIIKVAKQKRRAEEKKLRKDIADAIKIAKEESRPAVEAASAAAKAMADRNKAARAEKRKAFFGRKSKETEEQEVIETPEPEMPKVLVSEDPVESEYSVEVDTHAEPEEIEVQALVQVLVQEEEPEVQEEAQTKPRKPLLTKERALVYGSTLTVPTVMWAIAYKTELAKCENTREVRQVIKRLFSNRETVRNYPITALALMSSFGLPVVGVWDLLRSVRQDK
jgi:hypothetical protein